MFAAWLKTFTQVEVRALDWSDFECKYQSGGGSDEEVANFLNNFQERQFDKQSWSVEVELPWRPSLHASGFFNAEWFWKPLGNREIDRSEITMSLSSPDEITESEHPKISSISTIDRHVYNNHVTI